MSGVEIHHTRGFLPWTLDCHEIIFDHRLFSIMIFTMNVVPLLVLAALVFPGRLSRATQLLDDQNQKRGETVFQREEGELQSLDHFRTIEAHKDHSNNPAIAPKSWKTATRLLLELTSALSSSSNGLLCEAMKEEHVKFLGLSIARCHLNDMGMDLLIPNDFVRQNCTDMMALEHLFGCLKFLTSSGVHAYTHYVAHVQMLCTRLTNDAVITYQQESHDRLRNQFHDMSQQSLAQIEMLKRGMVELTAKLEDLAEFPATLREEMRQDLLEAWDESIQDMARGMEESLNTRMNEQLQSGTAQLLESLSDQHHHHWEQLLTKIVSREEEQETRHREWMKGQAQLLDAQSKEIAEQRQALARQREHIANMTALVVDATQQMKPLSSMEYFVRAAISGYGWITTVLYVLCAINVTWLVTSLSITREVRPYLLTLVWVEGTIEILARLSVVGSSSSDGHQRFVNDIRLLSVILAVATFILGIVWSLVRFLMTGWKRNPAADDHSAIGREPQQAEHILRRGIDYRPGFTVYQPRTMTANWETEGVQQRTSRRLLDENETVTTQFTRGGQLHRCVQIPRHEVLTCSQPGTSLVSSPSPVTLSRHHHNVQNVYRGEIETIGHIVTPLAPAVAPPPPDATLHGNALFFECQDIEIDEIEEDSDEDAVMEEQLTVLGPQFSRKRPRSSIGDKKDWRGILDKKPRYIQKNY